MAKTPEGKVKDAVKAALHARGVYPFMDVAQGKVKGEVQGTYYMPVAGQFSVHGVHDFVGCLMGRFFSLETKAPDNREDETYHQGCFREAVSQTGGIALTGVRDGQAAVERLFELLENTDAQHQQPAQ